MAPDHPDFWNNYGNLLRASGQLLDAANAYRRAVELRPSFPDAYNNLGLIFQAQEDYQEAIVAYRNALQYEPNHVAAHLNLGHASESRAGWPRPRLRIKKRSNFIRSTQKDIIDLAGSIGARIDWTKRWMCFASVPKSTRTTRTRF